MTRISTDFAQDGQININPWLMADAFRISRIGASRFRILLALVRRPSLSTKTFLAGLMLSCSLPICILAQDTPPGSSQAPLTLTLQDALARARANSVQFQAALTDQGIAHEDRSEEHTSELQSHSF